jgi:hypothetical protein
VISLSALTVRKHIVGVKYAQTGTAEQRIPADSHSARVAEKLKVMTVYVQYVKTRAVITGTAQLVYRNAATWAVKQQTGGTAQRVNCVTITADIGTAIYAVVAR